MRYFLLGFSALAALLPLSQAGAQNYLAARDYRGPGVIVNMDVVGGGSMPLARPMPRPMPVMRAPIQPVPVLTQPLAPPPVAAISPVISQPPVMPEMASSKPAALPAPAAIGLPMALNSKTTVDAVLSGMAPTIATNNMPTSFQPLKEASAGSVASEELGLPGPSSSSFAPAMPSPIMARPSAAADAGIQTAMLAPPATLAKPLAPIDAMPAKAAAPADNFEAYRLLFDASSDELKPSEKAVLDKVIRKLTADQMLRLQMQSYANGTPDTASTARRLSLTRAMKVRSYLMEKGISATRLDIRAMGMGSAMMGDKVGSGNAPADRVDVIFARS